VDSSGRVKTAKVLSGPAILQKVAVGAVKQCRYNPAMQNGKPVPAHFKVMIQFWLEP
jgi:TonB family protein